MKTVATYSIKGGVGKTTTAVNLAYESATSGARVLLWDVDPQGAATYFFRIKPKMKGGTRRLMTGRAGLEEHVRETDLPGLHLVPADFSLRNLDLHLDATKRPTERLSQLLDPLAAAYDLIILDCPPSISLASESVFAATDALVVPTIPTPLSARTLSQLASFLDGNEHAPRLLPHFSMVDARKRLHRELLESLPRQWPTFLRTPIPMSSAVERMATQRAPIASFAPRAPATEAFRRLWEELIDRLW